ncbi:Copper transport protein CTR3 [Paramyrothecium foliicola]|nr:Copper transport protein CTR3 [Paramyrothecium foliicola]
MCMDGMSSTTGTAAMPGSTPGAMDHGGMDHDMGGMPGMKCKISMLWNWYTLDTCFIAESWHNKTTGMFAGSCIGVVLLVILLEFLRRLGKEYDRYIVRRSVRILASTAVSREPAGSEPLSSGSQADDAKTPGLVSARRSKAAVSVRPTIPQQATRALLHTLQFAVAYFVMLLAMYYNGYIIICIFIGAYIGAFIFQWEALAGFGEDDQTRAGDNPTVCCG